MNDSPVRRCLPAVALAVAASLTISVAISMAVTPVLAQKGPRPLTPTTLAPPVTADPAPATNRNNPPRPGAAAADAAPPPAQLPGQPPARASDPATTQPGGPAPVRIEVDQLRRISPDSVGTLTAEQGGFGIDMWAGTGRRVIETLLPRLPVRTTSRAMRDLMRRLLLSTATAPPGGENAGSLVAMRLDALAALGDVAGTDALIKAAPSRGITEDLLRAEADLLFVTNDNARACPLVAGQIKDDVSTYWQKAFIFCQSLAGEHAKASLGVSLLREEGEEDPVFFGLIDRLSGVERFEIESLSNPAPLHFAMVRASRARLPLDVISSDNPSVLRTVATSPNARPELRIDAAERAENIGALRTDVLRQLYAGVTFSEDALDNPLTRAAGDRSPLSRALLYRKALVESVPTALAEVLNRAFGLAREGGRFMATARAYSGILGNLNPTQDLAWFAPSAVRAAIAANDADTAGRWLTVLRTGAVLNEEAALERDRLMPLLRLAGLSEDGGIDEQALRRWTEDAAADGGSGEQPARRASLLFNILESLGDEVPPELWAGLLAGPPRATVLMPRAAIWRTLGDAAENGRIGETVLLALLTLGEAGPAEADPIVLGRVLSSLRRAGLEADARAIALEAAIAAGI